MIDNKDNEELYKIISFQLEIIKDLKSENSALTEIILRQQNLLPKEEQEEKIEIPFYQKVLGKQPWHLRKATLERSHRKPSLQEVTGIREEDKDAQILGKEA